MAFVRARPPRVGDTRLVAVDGRSGSGKSSLADSLVPLLGASLIRMDDLYEGWSGLETSERRLHRWVVEPLATGAPVRWRRFDWATGEYAEWHEQAPSGVLIVEGCGAARDSLDWAYSTILWVEADESVRRRRLEQRGDWSTYRAHAQQWADDEQALFARERTRERANLIVDND